ncbi:MULTISPECIES: methyltransferase domain-containing protein [unclassified Geodermatophilus]|uniref:methyltransferase domain-containing protein n=1 Tax=unclassified Geodermatophilus TaxID=2637632 RepID=UPI003EEC4897
MTSTADRSGTEAFQVTAEAAELYESRFVPALFAEWAPLLADVAGVRPGQEVLDVACGTGIVARTVADRLAGTGRVVGLDLNEAMLAVARRVRPELEWRQGDVAALPFPDRSFDAVLCQMALMFFPDRTAALREMARVTRSGGVVALCVPAALEDQPAYAPFVDLVVRHAGPVARPLMGAYWACGDLDALRTSLTDAGLAVLETRTHLGTAAFESAEAMAVTEVEGSPLARQISPDVYARIRTGAREVLAPFTDPDGALPAPFRGHLVAARTPET